MTELISVMLTWLRGLGNWIILVPRAHDSSGLWLGSRALVWSKTGSPRFMDFPSNLANLIGWECETNTLRMLRKSGPARALDPNHRPEGSWVLGMRMELDKKKNSLKFNGDISNIVHFSCTTFDLINTSKNSLLRSKRSWHFDGQKHAIFKSY